MSSRIIPKEQLTAYQRWELLGLEGEEQIGQAQDTGQTAEAELAVSLPTAKELEQIHQQSAQEGFKIGHEEGYKAGYEMGRTAGEADARRLAELAQALDGELLRRDERLARELLDLALGVAKQMLRTTLRVKEGMVLEVLREAINSLPELAGHLRILVHPDDVEAVHGFLAGEHANFTAKVIGDGRIERGGFRIESSLSEVDAELTTRWQEIVNCLGSGSTWLD